MRSPAQILFARHLKDSIPCDPKRFQLRKEWILTADEREKALAKRHLYCNTQLANKSKELKPLQLGQTVQVQNQRGVHANKWDLSGSIVEVLEFDSYLVKMDGSGRVSKRNRRFLKPITTFQQRIANSLPNQTYSNDVLKHANTIDAEPSNNDVIYPGPSADKAERPSTLPLSNSQGVPQPDTLPQSAPMSDETFVMAPC